MIDFGNTTSVTGDTASASNMLKDVEYFVKRWLPLFLHDGSAEYNEIKAACDDASKVTGESKSDSSPKTTSSVTTVGLTSLTSSSSNDTGTAQLPFALIYGACWRLHTRLLATIAPPQPTARQIRHDIFTANVSRHSAIELIEQLGSVTMICYRYRVCAYFRFIFP
jgi:hypothetical protein